MPGRIGAKGLVILDRDGVINRDSPDFIRSAAEWQPIPGSLEAIARLNHAGIHVAIATNQSGLARGYFDIDALNAMHQKMHALLARVGGHVDGIFFCPHGPDDQCCCRKPRPGLYQEIARRCHTSLSGVPIIGDSRRDLEPAVAFGARPILVRTGKGMKTEASLSKQERKRVEVFRDLAAAVEHLVS